MYVMNNEQVEMRKEWMSNWRDGRMDNDLDEKKRAMSEEGAKVSSGGVRWEGYFAPPFDCSFLCLCLFSFFLPCIAQHSFLHVEKSMVIPSTNKNLEIFWHCLFVCAKNKRMQVFGGTKRRIVLGHIRNVSYPVPGTCILSVSI
jgi:hypothetical protein